MTKKNINKIREEMLAAGISPEKIDVYIESLSTLATMPTERTFAVRPTRTATSDDFVVTSDGSVCRRSEAVGTDSDPWDHRK